MGHFPLFLVLGSCHLGLDHPSPPMVTEGNMRRKTYFCLFLPRSLSLSLLTHSLGPFPIYRPGKPALSLRVTLSLSPTWLHQICLFILPSQLFLPSASF